MRGGLLVQPEKVIGEILGEPATRPSHLGSAEYRCPFINSECVKRGHHAEGPYPVCSVWHSKRAPRLIATCPKRFLQTDLVKDVIKHCWPGQPPTSPRVAYEVGMAKFGTVDMVVADLDGNGGTVREFVSVELQAVDLTGTVEPAYSGILAGLEFVETTYGVNWANVRKRYMSQLISKVYYHNRWDTRMAAVIQTPLYDRLREHIQFDELPAGHHSAVDVIFLLYDYAESAGAGGAHTLTLDRAVGTSHSSLMMNVLYQNPPPKEEFTARILERLG